jgi:hypothetical protein
VLDAFQAAAFDATGRAIAATVRDQVLQLVEEHVHDGGGRDIARMLRFGRLVDSCGRASRITYLAIRVHFAGLPIKLIGVRGGKP